jgi:hypothetical protein
MWMRVVALVAVATAFVTESASAIAQNVATVPVEMQSAPGSVEAQSQTAAPDSMPVSSTGSAAQQIAAAPAMQTVTVPAGTAIPLTLVSPIKSRSTKPGDSVRAMVAFPVTVGTQLAIPAGTYVEGTVARIAPHTLQNKLPEVEIHFQRMLFANGYAVDVPANSQQARLEVPATKAPVQENARNENAVEDPPPGSFAFAGQQTTQPTLPPLNHPNVGLIAGLTMGAGAALGIGMLVWAHHRATHTDYVLFDTGWQFEMVLTRPLTLDAGRVGAAAATPRAQ